MEAIFSLQVDQYCHIQRQEATLERGKRTYCWELLEFWPTQVQIPSQHPPGGGKMHMLQLAPSRITCSYVQCMSALLASRRPPVAV